jgi:hypothetical protein
MEDFGEEFRRLDCEHRTGSRRLPGENLAKHLGSLVGRPPTFNEAGIEVHDPVFWDAGSLVKLPLETPIPGISGTSSGICISS